MANYIHSTASQPMIYPIYAGTGSGQNQAQKIKEIFINGTANVVDPRTLMTPTGAVTEVSDADLELLKKSAAFQRHCARGFMRVMGERELNTKDMQPRDNSSQILDDEFAEGRDPRPTLQGSGSSVASCKEGDAIRGKKGYMFQADTY